MRKRLKKKKHSCARGCRTKWADAIGGRKKICHLCGNLRSLEMWL